MDFELNGQQQLFRKTVHEWVDHEVPKSCSRELEKYEHNFPRLVGQVRIHDHFRGLCRLRHR